MKSVAILLVIIFAMPALVLADNQNEGLEQNTASAADIFRTRQGDGSLVTCSIAVK